MSEFVAVRHTTTGGIGSVPVEALEIHLHNGWVVISDPAPEPFDLDVPAIDPATPETDAGRALRASLRPDYLPPLADEAPAPPVEVDAFEVAKQLAEAVDPTGDTPAGLLAPADKTDASTNDTKKARSAVVEEN
jgi:hypothetical protein